VKEKSGATPNWLVPLIVIGSGLALFYSVHLIFQDAPNDVELGFAQKIFYFHLPAALLGYLGFTICCVASIVYLRKPSGKTDAIARTGASVGVLFCAMVLVSGPLWAKKSWGTFWTGEPRLVLTLALFIIFLAYVLVRAYGGKGPLTRRVGAVLAIFGFADIPLVRYAVKKWGGNHPQVVTGEGGGIGDEMKLALWFCMFAFCLLFVALFWVRLRTELLSEELEELGRDIGDREYLIEDAS